MGLEVQVIPRDAGQIQFALVPHIRRIAGVGVTFAVNEDAVLPPAGGDSRQRKRPNFSLYPVSWVLAAMKGASASRSA